MFKIINFEPNDNDSLINVNYKNYNFYQLKKDPILENHHFVKTLVGIGSTEILNLEKRSSWKHKLKFWLKMPNDVYTFFNQNNIIYGDEDDWYSLLKYETGDFFLNHCDTKLPDYTKDNCLVTHQYTCLIFCPYEDIDILEGGELIFQHPESLYEIKLDPSVETKKNKFMMLIFSIDMHHEVLPVLKGKRWVLKKPLFVKTMNISSKPKEEEEEEKEELCDGYSDWMNNSNGDY